MYYMPSYYLGTYPDMYSFLSTSDRFYYVRFTVVYPKAKRYSFQYRFSNNYVYDHNDTIQSFEIDLTSSVGFHNIDLDTESITDLHPPQST